MPFQLLPHPLIASLELECHNDIGTGRGGGTGSSCLPLLAAINQKNIKFHQITYTKGKDKNNISIVKK
jgi:hypothetical protein